MQADTSRVGVAALRRGVRSGCTIDATAATSFTAPRARSIVTSFVRDGAMGERRGYGRVEATY